MALICILALVVFAVMGIFSAKYRRYVAEAFHCFLNTIRLRKCESKLDEKIKAEIVSAILPYSTVAAKIVHNHFELLSSIFVIIITVSAIYSAIGVYNLVAYGNCNGPAGGFCILNDVTDSIIRSDHLRLKLPQNSEGQVFGNANYKVVVYEFGCYSCKYTAHAEKIVQQLYSRYGDKVEFVYKTYPLPGHRYSNEAALASWCAYEQGEEKYAKFRKMLFEKQQEWGENGNHTLVALANESELDIGLFKECFEERKYQNKIDKLVKEGKSIGVYGTPTFFIGNRSFVGVISYEELRNAIEEELKK